MRATGVWDVHGVEINGEVAEFARRRYGIDIVPGTLEAVAYPAAFFDAVTMWDVLEHLHDPSATLREIHRILKPGGILVVRVPNLASWDATLFGRYWAGLDAPRHLYVFSPTTLSNMLAQNRYAVLEHSCAIGSYPTFALSARFWLTGRRASGRVQRWANRILYHPLARLASAPLFYLSSHTLRGPLLVTVARKE
jgi:SAM-dependent methyltransferase